MCIFDNMFGAKVHKELPCKNNKFSKIYSNWKFWKNWLPCWNKNIYFDKMLKHKEIMYVSSMCFDYIHVSCTHNLPHFLCYSMHPMFTHNQRHDLCFNKARTPSSMFSISWNKSSYSQAFLPYSQSIISCL